MIFQAIHIMSEAAGESGHGFTTHHWLLPETAEIIYGGLASILVFSALAKFALPMAKKSLADRTARIAAEIDKAKTSRAEADSEAARIRGALGNITAERQRILAEADAQAASVLADGRARVSAEVADLEAKAKADIAASAGRVNEELKGEIARLSSIAVERVVKAAMNESDQQKLIENFINNVGATK